MLAAAGLTKKYGTSTALDCLNLKITPGEIFCLLGAERGGQDDDQSFPEFHPADVRHRNHQWTGCGGSSS
jgi:hypothetical protein